MRDALSKILVRHGVSDSSVIVLTGDHGYALFDSFRSQCPEQFINAGIAEQNMIGMAAGMAKIGFRPYIYGLSAFIPMRVLEQIKIDLAHDALPVILIGDGAGLVYSHLGSSHQCTEDIAVTRAIPNLEIYSPCDSRELDLCFRSARESKTTAYIRIGKADRGEVHSDDIHNWKKGDLIQVADADEEANKVGALKLAFIATGSMVRTALNVKRESFTGAEVWSAPTLKPINRDQILAISEKIRTIVVMEEHSVFGGLGSVVAEILSESGGSNVLRIGVQDRFSEKCGSYEYLLKEHQLDENSIRNKIYKFTSTTA
jgi:transketolase